MAEKKELTGPDLARGISLSKLADGSMLQGHAKGEPILVARRGDGYFAIGAMCTHYGAPLATGILVDDTVRCPWHHACFSLRTGEALRAPALDSVTRRKVETRDGKLFVRDKVPAKKPRGAGSAKLPENVVIVGGGAAGNAAAEMLRREGYHGDLTLLSADDSVPYDRPTLSKDFLNGSASQKMIPLRSKDFYKKHEIELLLKTRVGGIDPRNKVVQLADGKQRKFDALLLATGAEPVKLKVPGADLAHVIATLPLAPIAFAYLDELNLQPCRQMGVHDLLSHRLLPLLSLFFRYVAVMLEALLARGSFKLVGWPGFPACASSMRPCSRTRHRG